MHLKHFPTCLLVVGPDVTLHQRETASRQSVSLSSVIPGNRKLIAIRVFLRCDHIMGATLQSPDSSAGLRASCTRETSIIFRPRQPGSPKKPQLGCDVRESLHRGKVGGEMQMYEPGRPLIGRSSSPSLKPESPSINILKSKL